MSFRQRNLTVSSSTECWLLSGLNSKQKIGKLLSNPATCLLSSVQFEFERGIRNLSDKNLAEKSISFRRRTSKSFKINPILGRVGLLSITRAVTEEEESSKHDFDTSGKSKNQISKIVFYENMRRIFFESCNLQKKFISRFWSFDIIQKKYFCDFKKKELQTTTSFSIGFLIIWIIINFEKLFCCRSLIPHQRSSCTNIKIRHKWQWRIPRPWHFPKLTRMKSPANSSYFFGS